MRIKFFYFLATAAVAFSCLTGCSSDDPDMTIEPLSGIDTYTISPNQEIELKVKIEHFGKSSTSLIAMSSDSNYAVAAGALAEDGSGTVTVSAPKYILNATTFTVTVTASDDHNQKTASQIFNINAEASPNIVISAESANSFIVKPGSLFGFTANKGNSSESVSIDQAVVLWQDTKGLINDIFVEGNVIHAVLTAGAEGNAVVAALKDNKVQWSWNLWVTDYDPSANSFSYASGETIYTMMDRNLGALSSSSGSDKVNGNFYQWGRKDAFPGSTFNDTLKVSYDFKGDTAKFNYEPVHEVLNVENSIANPMTHYSGVSGGNYSWVSSDFASVDKETVKNLWGGESQKKSLYDPCPAGWEVAPISALGFYTDKAISKEKVYDGAASNKNFRGMNITLGEKTYFFPAQGEVPHGGEYCNGVGSTWPCGKVWSANTDNMESKSYFRGACINVTPSSCSSGKVSLGYALSVRCVKE